MKLTAGISYSQVKEAYDCEKEGRLKQRLLIILKAFKIKSSYKIAEQVGITHTKVQRWINRFNKNSFNGLKDLPRNGRPSQLTNEQKIALDKKLNTKKEFSTGWKTLEVIDEIKKSYAIKYTSRHVRRLLHLLGYSRVKPRPIHVKKDSIKGKVIVENIKKNSFVWVKNGQSFQKTNSA